MKPEKHISPSLICMDLCNLERDVKELEACGIRMVHVDILDGYFSPSMPLGMDTVRQLRKKTSLAFDAHVMAVENDFFLCELMDIGVQRLCFQAETERHISRKLTVIKNAGIAAGVALAPSTPLSAIEYTVELCDFVLLMRINPGFASFGGETDYGFMNRKIADLKAMIDARGLQTQIELDGRIRTEELGTLRKLGSDIFVAGTSCLFKGEGTLAEKMHSLRESMAAL